MSNRRFIFIIFLFGIGLFLLGIVPRSGISLRERTNTDVSKSQTLGEKSTSSISSSPGFVQGSEISQNLYKVLKVIDGDTIDVQIEGQKETVRLIGIDAPETGQCFGIESTNKARELLNSQFIVLEKDPSQGERDRYGRLLGYVLFQDGANFNELMIREGYAKEYTYRTAYKYQSLFKNAEQDARDNKRGLWQDGACSSSTTEPQPSRNIQNNVQGSYTCDCSKLCSQISTCDEAYYQLNQCGCTKRDSDKDGVPCESLCK